MKSQNKPIAWTGFSGGTIEDVPTSADPVAIARIHARRQGLLVRAARRTPDNDTPTHAAVEVLLPGGIRQTFLIPKESPRET